MRVIGEGCLAKLTTDTGLLVATEWQLMVESVVCVDPDGPGLERIRNIDGRVEVCGVDSGSETVGGAVADPDGISLVFELGNGADGAEDFFLHDLHVFADVGENGGLDEVALLSVALAANFNLGAFLLSLIDVSGWLSNQGLFEQEL